MSILFEAQSNDITELTDLQLTKLLKMLLHLEARTFGISQGSVEVALNIRVADGGEDGRIQWRGGPAYTNYLPLPFVQFQNKATHMTPAECASEILGRDGKVKAMVDKALTDGAAYILFTTQELNQSQKDRRIVAIRKKLHALGMRYADTVVIDIYDASKIQGWVNRYVPAITAVLNWTGRPLVDGLQTWFGWENYDEHHSFEYVADRERRAAIDTLRELLEHPRKSARIIGLSGLGKTRLAFEACKGDEGHDGFKDRVVYIDAACGIPNLPGVVAGWVQRGLEGLLVVDNCDLQLHQQLCREVEHRDSHLSLLTLHYDPDKDGDTASICLGAMDDESIKNMLETVYGERIADLDRVAVFAQGFPQMAVLLAEARLDQSEHMGSLTDDVIVSKMLWGSGETDVDSERMLQACALFDKFGVEDEASSEFDFIAEAVITTNADALYRCLKKFERRGVINSVGRYSQIIPKPLAIRLAADWWRCTRREKQKELLTGPMPGQLEDSFCTQVAKLDFLPEVKDFTAELCGDQGPFGHAEVILSLRGSRLFRALVEVNPSATCDALFRVINRLSPTRIAAIGGDIRRNLVGSLEKLCYHEHCFAKAARILLLLASEENEAWSNNATGQFLQLFRVFLSGNAAAPAQRLELIDEARQSGSSAIRKLAVAALDSAIDTYGSSRLVGAEYQGSGTPLEEWRPAIWQDAFDYWTAAIERLGTIAIERGSESTDAKRSMARHIRGLVRKGEDVMRALDAVLGKIVEVDGPLWPEALDGVKQSLSYDSGGLPEHGVAKLHEWLVLLTPESLEDKLRLLVANPPFEYDTDESVDLSQRNAEALARELAETEELLSSHLAILLEGEQRQAMAFGQELVKSSGRWEPLLSDAIQYVASAEHPAPQFLLGLLSGVYNRNPSEWECYVARFADEPRLTRFYPVATTSGRVSAQHLQRVLGLVQGSLLEPAAVSIWSYGRVLEGVQSDSVAHFADALSCHSAEAAWVSLDILSMYSHGDPVRQVHCEESLKEIMLRLPLDKPRRNDVLDLHHWQKAAQRILDKDEPEFAAKLMVKVVEAIGSGVGYGVLHNSVRPIVSQMLEQYAEAVWPVLGDAIVSADSVRRFRFSILLGSDDHLKRGVRSVLAALPEPLLRRWCDTNPSVAPTFVAGAADAFADFEGHVELSARAMYLLDEFGDSEDVLNALSANMGSFGWVGSVVPHYEREIGAVEPLLRHRRPAVRAWADRRIEYLRRKIEIEHVRDAEERWGIR